MEIGFKIWRITIFYHNCTVILPYFNVSEVLRPTYTFQSLCLVFTTIFPVIANLFTFDLYFVNFRSSLHLYHPTNLHYGMYNIGAIQFGHRNIFFLIKLYYNIFLYYKYDQKRGIFQISDLLWKISELKNAEWLSLRNMYFVSLIRLSPPPQVSIFYLYKLPIVAWGRHRVLLETL